MQANGIFTYLLCVLHKFRTLYISGQIAIHFAFRWPMLSQMKSCGITCLVAKAKYNVHVPAGVLADESQKKLNKGTSSNTLNNMVCRMGLYRNHSDQLALWSYVSTIWTDLAHSAESYKQLNQPNSSFDVKSSKRYFTMVLLKIPGHLPLCVFRKFNITCPYPRGQTPHMSSLVAGLLMVQELLIFKNCADF